MYPPSYTFLGSLELAQKHENVSFVQTGTHFMKKAFANTDFALSNENAAYMVDYTERKYCFVHKAVVNILGYSATYFIKNGMDAYVDKWHPEDFEIYNKKVFPDNIAFLKCHAPEKSVDFVFSHTLRIKGRDGNYTTLLQRSCFVLSPQGVPLGTVGYVTDISPFKRDNSLVHVIAERNANNSSKTHQVVLQNNYYPGLYMLSVSKREVEVLKWICEGLSSKQIADKMQISTHTVNNHRKSMLQKTNCKNSFELLSFAVKNGII